MQIKELAAATGVDTETIHFYEEGLLPQPARLANGYRSYEPVHLERLSFVRHCRALDIPWRTSRACWARWMRRKRRVEMSTI